MSSLAQVTTAGHSLLTTISEAAATSTACVQRVRCFTGPIWMQTLVLGDELSTIHERHWAAIA